MQYRGNDVEWGKRERGGERDAREHSTAQSKARIVVSAKPVVVPKATAGMLRTRSPVLNLVTECPMELIVPFA